MAGAAGITVVNALLACLGCKIPTKVRHFGKPYHFGCLPPDRAKRMDFQEPQAPALKLRFLEDLHDTWAPKKKTAGRLRSPYWMAPAPPITESVETPGWSWKRPGDYLGPRAVLDRTASFLSAASSVEVAHGALVPNPGCGLYDGLPGFYKVMWHPWEEEGIEHPLGGWDWRTTREHERWVPHTRAALLQELARAGRYPDGFITDAYTCAADDAGKPDRTDLKKWARHVQGTRKAVIDRYGRYDESQPDGQTREYKAVKTNFSQAVTMMTGASSAGQGRSFKPSCRVRRPDWGMAISDLSAVMLWRRADQARQIAKDLGRPDLGPVEMRNVDELVVPVEVLPYLREHIRPGGRDLIDQAGIELGTFKVKFMEEA